MSETTDRSRAVNDITAEDYRAIENAVYDVHFRVHRLMDRTAGASDPAWHELHEMMSALSVVSSAARRYADRARLSQEPADCCTRAAERDPSWPATLAAHDAYRPRPGAPFISFAPGGDDE